MRILFLSTSSNETTKYADSLKCLNPESVRIIRYDEPQCNDPQLFSIAREYDPAFIVYIGSRWGAQPSITTLAMLTNKVAPSVHICSDAADPPWHDLLNEYHYKGAFAVQVAIDGNKNWPTAEKNLTLLTPVEDFAPAEGLIDHDKRNVIAGYAGNPGSDGSLRRTIISELAFRQSVKVRLRDGDIGTYPDYFKFLLDCRLSLNIALSATQTALQVKGRVLESGLAGCCLLETARSPASEWFTPGVDYFEYSGWQQADDLIKKLACDPLVTQAMGSNLRKKVLAEHSPLRFWSKILDRIGIRRA